MTQKPKYDLYFYAIILLHLIIWTTLPALLRHNLNLDSMEAIAWGHEWQLGYEKHPPLSAYLSEAMIIISKKSIWSIFLLSQICVILAFFITWKIAKKFLEERSALMATILLECVYYYNFTSIEFNPNVLLLPITALFTYLALKLYEKNNLRDWLLIAAIAALGIYTKYSFAIFPAAFFVLLVSDKKRIFYFKSINPYIAFLTFFLLAFPHLKWMFDNEFSTIAYAAQRLQTDYHFYNHLSFPLSFLLAQLFSLSLAILVFSSLESFKFKSANFSLKNEKAKFIIVMSLLPFLFTIIPSLLTGSKIKDMWGSYLWNMSGIFLFYFFPPKFSKITIKKFYIRWFGVAALAIGAYVASTVKIDRYADYNGKYLAEELNKFWRDKYNQPLEIVAGDIWIAGNFGLYAPDRPHVFIELNEEKSAWLSYQKLAQKGGIVVWNARLGKEIPDEYIGKDSEILSFKIMPNIILPYINHEQEKPFILGWAIVKPASSNSVKSK